MFFRFVSVTMLFRLHGLYITNSRFCKHWCLCRCLCQAADRAGWSKVWGELDHRINHQHLTHVWLEIFLDRELIIQKLRQMWKEVKNELVKYLIKYEHLQNDSLLFEKLRKDKTVIGYILFWFIDIVWIRNKTTDLCERMMTVSKANMTPTRSPISTSKMTVARKVTSHVNWGINPSEVIKTDNSFLFSNISPINLSMSWVLWKCVCWV